MTKHSEIFDAEWRDSLVLKKGLNKLRIHTFFVPVFFSIAYLVLRITNAFQWESGIWVILGIWTGTILGTVFELKPKYIYNFSVYEESIIIYLVSIYGIKKDVVFPKNKIKKVKLRNKNLLRGWDKVWIHLNGSVKEFYFIEKGLGNKMIEKLNVEVI